MSIRTTDNKGRIHINEKGKAYKVWEADDGTITLFPITIPEPPRVERGTMPGIYVRASRRMSEPDTVMLYTTFGSGAGLANMSRDVAALAKEHHVPVVVDGRGVGHGLTDLLRSEGIEVIEVMA